MGRDDRCIAASGREARYPFLDEQVLRTLSAIPLHAKLDPRLPEGQGDKRLLRQCAARLGLDGPARLRKRVGVDELAAGCSDLITLAQAIQFGSRSAKQDTGRVEGHEIMG